MNWTLLDIKKTFFSKVQWLCLRAWGPIQGSNIKNVWLACEKIMLTFGKKKFFLIFHGFKKISSYFLFLVHTMDERRHKIPQSIFLNFLLFFGMGTGFGIYSKFKSPSTCEIWHFNALFFSQPSCIYKNWKCIPFSNNLMRIYKTNQVNSRIGQEESPCDRIHKTSHVNSKLVKDGGVATISSIHSMSPIIAKFEQQR